MVTAPQHRDDDLAAAVTGHGVIGYLDRPPRDDVVEGRRRTRSRRSELRNGIGLERREEMRAPLRVRVRAQRRTVDGHERSSRSSCPDHCHVTDAPSSSDGSLPGHRLLPRWLCPPVLRHLADIRSTAGARCSTSRASLPSTGLLLVHPRWWLARTLGTEHAWHAGAELIGDADRNGTIRPVSDDVAHQSGDRESDRIPRRALEFAYSICSSSHRVGNRCQPLDGQVDARLPSELVQCEAGDCCRTEKQHSGVAVLAHHLRVHRRRCTRQTEESSPSRQVSSDVPEPIYIDHTSRPAP